MIPQGLAYLLLVGSHLGGAGQLRPGHVSLLRLLQVRHLLGSHLSLGLCPSCLHLHTLSNCSTMSRPHAVGFLFNPLTGSMYDAKLAICRHLAKKILPLTPRHRAPHKTSEASDKILFLPPPVHPMFIDISQG